MLLGSSSYAAEHWSVGQQESQLDDELLWPAFVAHEACAFKKRFSEEPFEGFVSQTGGDRKSVEIVMNPIHIVNIVGDPERVSTREQILHMGRKLEDVCPCKVSRDLPTREFIVSFPEAPRDDLRGYVITFFQESHEPAG